MRHLFTTAAIVASLSLAAPAMAQSSHGFESTLSSPISMPVNVEVVLGEDLAYRADNLPKKLRDRASSGGRMNSGFSQNGYYGERDLNRLVERLEDRMEKQLTKRGVTVSEGADTVMRLIITDARPNRPTFNQLSKEPGLSYRSFGNGGAAIEGEIIQAGGESLGEFSYAWYENDIDFAAHSGTWTDAHRALDRFARKTAKFLQQQPDS